MVEYESFSVIWIDDGAAIFLLAPFDEQGIAGRCRDALKWLLERFVQSPLEGAVFGAVTTAAVQTAALWQPRWLPSEQRRVHTGTAFAVILGPM